MLADGSVNNSSNLPPPFLIKTYEMVDDPSTDHVVSWSDNNCSFVVWNVADFTEDLLPQYFKHKNFSSFVRQLNTYGFHKIDPERQEFANEGFSKDNKENLKNIHRRKPSTSHNHSQLQKEHNLIGCNDPAHVGLEEEVAKLQKEKGFLLAELLKVKQQQEGTEVEMESLGHRLQALEERQQQMMAFLARVLGIQAGSSAKCAQQLRQMESSMSLTFNKKRRLQDKQVVIGVGESWEDDEGGSSKQIVRYYSGEAGDAVSSASMVKTEMDASAYEQVLRQFAGSTLNHSNETSPMSRTSGVTSWEIPTPINTDSAGSTLPATPAECCNPNPCKITICEEHNRAASPSTLQDDQAGAPDQCKGKEGVMQVTNSACGSNDVFWGNLLTENPRLSDKSGDACQGERWFL